MFDQAHVALFVEDANLSGSEAERAGKKEMPGMYVQRDADERILSVSRMPTAECTEPVAADDSELLQFLSEVREDDERARLQQSDLDFVRVLEDVLDLLMDKGVISFTDLPEAARRKIMQRQSLRRRYNDVDLVGDDEPLI
ncbi:hypothetical protein SAMN05660971_04286 [Halomonas cupida]|uniref:Tryptophan synthase subunit beta like protein n=2 Tax=Halomonas cupida TaxID=44933 RepID=A0A1M7MPG9_9GAMM|nr:hypothetical protein SAMN05660971_04286 [Halomonas cupida]